MKIGTREVGNGASCLVVAEMGINHNGSLERAIEMVKAAHGAGCMAIKVQAFTPEEFVGEGETYTYQHADGTSVTESQADMFSRCALSAPQLQAIRGETSTRGMLMIATATDAQWIETCVKMGVDALKVGSDDLTHVPLLRAMRHSGLPVILSTGMANGSEITRAVDECKPAALLHCVSLYPTPPKRANLARMDALKRFGVPVGFSDHTDGVAVSSAAIFHGAAILEKHFTLDKHLPGPDHRFSASQDELKTICSIASFAAKVLGDGSLDPRPEEAEMAKLARRSIVAARDIPAWKVLEMDDLAFRRPGTGVSPLWIDHVIGAVCAGPFKAGQFVNLVMDETPKEAMN